MKTASFGIAGLGIVFFTILATLTVTTTHTRTVNLQDNLQRVLETSLETAMDERAYNINSDDELVADVVEGMALYLDDNCDLKIEVNELDRTLGILSVKATVGYNPVTQGKLFDRNSDGVVDDADRKRSEVTAERTVILEQYDVENPGKFKLAYYVVDGNGRQAMYKTYQLTEGVKCMAPKDPSANFDGRWYTSGGDAYTPAQIEAMDLTGDMTFYSKRP